MHHEEQLALAKARLEIAESLLSDARDLLQKGSYRSANNRAFYSMEKSVKAILALKGTDASSHNALARTFHNEYVNNGTEQLEFSHDEYKMFVLASSIRTNSDYDDFYVCSKEECEKQVETAEHYLKRCSEIVEAAK